MKDNNAVNVMYCTVLYFNCYLPHSGIILYELHIILMVVGRGQLSSEPVKAKADLRRSLSSLQECLAVLQNEPQGTFAAKIYAGAKESEPQVEKFLRAAINS
jgi:hypothetical protein